MDTSCLKTIYWKMHTAFLKNDRKTSDYMLGLLQHESAGDDVAVERAIGPIHYCRYARIRDEITFGSYGRLYGDGISVPIVQELARGTDAKEPEFHKLLINNKKFLFNKLNISSRATIVHEFDMNPYGRCDMLIKDARCWHVVEIKRGEAPTSVVSQIDKYRLSAELDMCMGMHDSVLAAVIAGSFPPYVISELSRLSIRMVSHDGTAENLRLI